MTLSKAHRAAIKRRRGSTQVERVDTWSTAREKVDAGPCRACLATGHMDPAHTIPRSLGGGQSADSVIPLCRGCHDDQHAGYIELLPLLTRDEEVEAVRVLGIARAMRYLTDRESAAMEEAEHDAG